MEMSTPVTQIWEGILLLPLVGLIDSKRAQDIMNASLAKIAENPGPDHSFWTSAA